METQTATAVPQAPQNNATVVAPNINGLVHAVDGVIHQTEVDAAAEVDAANAVVDESDAESVEDEMELWISTAYDEGYAEGFTTGYHMNPRDTRNLHHEVELRNAYIRGYESGYDDGYEYRREDIESYNPSFDYALDFNRDYGAELEAYGGRENDGYDSDEGDFTDDEDAKPIAGIRPLKRRR